MPGRGTDVQLYRFFSLGARWWLTPCPGHFTSGNIFTVRLPNFHIFKESTWYVGIEIFSGQPSRITSLVNETQH